MAKFFFKVVKMVSISTVEWQKLLKNEFDSSYYKTLSDFVDFEYKHKIIYPQKENIFFAFENTPFSDVKVVLLGQDPYHGPNQAHGLSFSVDSLEAKFPPSLRNIFKELESDLSIKRTRTNLEDWAKQGIFLLNTTLTVEAGKAGSHRKKGWETFTDKVISLLNERKDPVIFVLWGKDAQNKIPLITSPEHFILTAPHPSPLSAYHGFFGTKPFSQINGILKNLGKAEIFFGDPPNS